LLRQGVAKDRVSVPSPDAVQLDSEALWDVVQAQVKPGDQVLSAEGTPIGVITSCSVDGDGFRLGQVYIQQSHTVEGTPIQIVLSTAGVTNIPLAATILSRFPKAKKAAK